MKIPILSDAGKYARLALDLRSFLHNTITLEQSKQVISQRLQNREKNFLTLVQKGIFENPKSPYTKLLKIVGCEFGDIELQVNRDGIEATLQNLLAQGIYLSWDEFKGKKDIIRNGNHFRFNERDFDNPFLANYYYARSSGTRSAGTRTSFDFTHMLHDTYYRVVLHVANNTWDYPIGIWHAELPSGAGINNLLLYSITEKPAIKWFSPVTENQTMASFRDRVATRYIVYSGRLCGAKLVKPEYVGLDNAIKVAQWMAAAKKRFGGCLLSSFVSPAVKVCQASMQHGLDIRGTHFLVGGEPLTEAKRKQIESTGAYVTPGYWISEIGNVGMGCAKPAATDDIHLFSDSVALIQQRRKVEHTDVYVNAFLFSSVSLSSRKILLNVESDDYGILETRSCGCLFEELGFRQHLHDIRSFAKLTGSGMTIVGSDFVRILEEVLPQKYGGAPTDYQLLEEEDSKGQTHLSLIISPDIGDVDENIVRQTVLNELRQSAHGGKLAAGFWSQVDTLQVKRIHPISSSGKIITLQLMKKR